MHKNQFLIYGVGALASYALYRFWFKAAEHLSRQVARKLPIEKHLNTITDQAGNYDIDGVSFDSEGVIVSGDDNKHLDPLHPKQ